MFSLCSRNVIDERRCIPKEPELTKKNHKPRHGVFATYVYPEPISLNVGCRENKHIIQQVLRHLAGFFAVHGFHRVAQLCACLGGGEVGAEFRMCIEVVIRDCERECSANSDR